MNRPAAVLGSLIPEPNDGNDQDNTYYELQSGHAGTGPVCWLNASLGNRSDVFYDFGSEAADPAKKFWKYSWIVMRAYRIARMPMYSSWATMTDMTMA